MEYRIKNSISDMNAVALLVDYGINLTHLFSTYVARSS